MIKPVWAVIPAAGRGTRMGAEIPKQYLPLAGRTVIEHTLTRLAGHAAIHGLVLVLDRDDQWWPKLSLSLPIPLHTAQGGAERYASVLNGLRALDGIAGPGDWVLVHDAARPCLRHADLDRLLATLVEHPVGGILALPVADTMKRGDGTGNVLETINREDLWRALTPQMFRLQELRQALENAVYNHYPVTDEASAMELYGMRPCLVEGHPDNIKITHPADLELAELFIRRQEQAT